MDERMKILEMLAEGTITVEEAKELLDTLDNQKVIVESKGGTKEIAMAEVVRSQVGKVLHIKVASEDGDKVDVNLPLAFIKAAIKIGSATELLKKSINVGDSEFLKGIDPEIIISSIEHGVVGKIIDLKSADGDKVEVYID
jgi:tRNA-binding EMAP/Myf-like protein